MSKKMKRTAVFLILFLVVSAMVFAGGTTEKAKARTVELNPVGTYPIVKGEPVDIVLLTHQPVYIEDLNTNRFSKHLEELGNINIIWETIPRDAIKEKLNITLASGDYPDAFFGVSASEQGINASMEMIYGVQEGVFIPLEDLIDNHMPNLKKLLDERPGIREFLTAPDGHIYSLPDFNECFHCSVAQKLWIYQPWLDKLGLDMPETTEDLYKVLVAFRDQDPNGNGLKDEIPFAGSVGGWLNHVEGFIMNSFIYSNMVASLDVSAESSIGFYRDGDVIKTIVNTQEYREGLRYLNKLYKEGLLYPPSFTQDAKQLTQLVEGPEQPIVGVAPGGYSGMFSIVGSERYRGFRAVPPLKGPTGEQNTRSFLQQPVIGGLVITKDAKHPEVIARLMDYLYTTEGTLTSNNGFEGEGWEWAKPGQVGLDGKPALWTMLKPWNDMDPQNDAFVMLGVRANTSRNRDGQAVDPNVDIYSDAGLETLLYQVSAELYKPYERPEKEIPTLRFLEEESDAFATKKVAYANYVRQSLVKFVTGDMDLDRDWNTYLRNLDSLELPAILAVNQKAYDRQNSK